MAIDYKLPPAPRSAVVKHIYPWEHTNLFNLCQELYTLAAKTGYNGTFKEFKNFFGSYLENNNTIINYDEYQGQYIITPLPDVEQILRTSNKILNHDVIVEPIPYYTTTNAAGGYTVTIG